MFHTPPRCHCCPREIHLRHLCHGSSETLLGKENLTVHRYRGGPLGKAHLRAVPASFGFIAQPQQRLELSIPAEFALLVALISRSLLLCSFPRRFGAEKAELKSASTMAGWHWQSGWMLSVGAGRARGAQRPPHPAPRWSLPPRAAVGPIVPCPKCPAVTPASARGTPVSSPGTDQLKNVPSSICELGICAWLV